MNLSELKNAALKKLEGKWFKSVGVLFLAFLISGAIAFVLDDYVLGFLTTGISAALGAGIFIYFLKLSREEEETGDLFVPFRISTYGLGLVAVPILSGLLVFLGMFLFVVPGIILSYSFRYAVLIKYDNPELSAIDALRESYAIMQGHKFESFLLDLTFIGWFFLGLMTFMVGGFLFSSTYYQATLAEFYETIRRKDEPQPSFIIQ